MILSPCLRVGQRRRNGLLDRLDGLDFFSVFDCISKVDVIVRGWDYYLLNSCQLLRMRHK